MKTAERNARPGGFFSLVSMTPCVGPFAPRADEPLLLASAVLWPLSARAAVELSWLFAVAGERPTTSHAFGRFVDLFHVEEFHGESTVFVEAVVPLPDVVPEIFFDLMTAASAVFPTTTLVFTIVPGTPFMTPAMAGREE